jgi:hypothetical protein
VPALADIRPRLVNLLKLVPALGDRVYDRGRLATSHEQAATLLRLPRGGELAGAVLQSLQEREYDGPRLLMVRRVYPIRITFYLPAKDSRDDGANSTAYLLDQVVEPVAAALRSNRSFGFGMATVRHGLLQSLSRPDIYRNERIGSLHYDQRLLEIEVFEVVSPAPC